MDDRIYFDHAATTPLDPRVRAAMEPFESCAFGNPSSLHREGRIARDAVETARAQVADLIGSSPDEITFTASGTEADNLAVLGLVASGAKARVVASAIEHPAVLKPLRHLADSGVEVDLLPPDEEGIIRPGVLLEALRRPASLISVMAANNVTGVLQPVAELAAVAKERGALFHTDAVQAAGKVPLDVNRMHVDMLALSAHKLHGPKGVGALFVRAGVRLRPVILGGGQERGLRSATENVAGIVGMGEAAAIAKREMAAEASRLVGLRDRLLDGIRAAVPNAYLIGHSYRRLPGHLCLGFAGQEGEAIRLLLALDEAGAAVSSGSACSADHAGEPSYILRAMGFDPIRARGSLRLTLGRFSTECEVDRFLEILPQAVSALRPVATHAAFGVRL